MPVHSYTIKAGTTSKLFLVFARDTEMGGGEGKRGLVARTPGVRAAYVRDGSRATEISLTQGEVGRWSSGGFAEVDPDLMPGVYQIGAPDEMLAEGATRALLMLRFPGADIDPVDVELVAFDPQDPARMGMRALGPEARLEALRGAFPRLAAKELEELRAVEGDRTDAASSREILRGLGAAPGTAIGAARVLRSEAETFDVPQGAIVVARLLNPYQAPVLFKAAGVVVEEGGLLQHATILAREFGVPAVVGLRRATDLLADGELLEVRGDTGEVHRLG
jgi:phosphohistidine swiveling domain-containing protein